MEDGFKMTSTNPFFYPGMKVNKNLSYSQAKKQYNWLTSNGDADGDGI